ncbi:hypothetical protein PR001_g7570 [Phytophthora rubi]|uniref:CWF21 domain-containing protein n=1 Tax=Phytophthora rubi TaxID=129364 RepID=A0A6A3JLI0_9STRA|nr:hypothetical protein PR002_g19926 [Phytophthora rubi]KAE9039299.1 hypothetical protein PR001_g7570 [Phytophthora rubi]
MYNGIGLRTVRGSGTNGYVQRNLSYVNALRTRQTLARNQRGGSSGDFGAHRGGKSRPPPNADILLHEQKRKVELQLLEMSLEMEERGCDPDEIQDKVKRERERLLARLDVAGDRGRAKDAESSHARQKRKEEENRRIKDAFGIATDYVAGESFDPEAQERRRQERKERREQEWKEREEGRQQRLKEREEREEKMKARRERFRSPHSRSRSRPRRSRSSAERHSRDRRSRGRDDPKTRRESKSKSHSRSPVAERRSRRMSSATERKRRSVSSSSSESSRSGSSRASSPSRSRSRSRKARKDKRSEKASAKTKRAKRSRSRSSSRSVSSSESSSGSDSDRSRSPSRGRNGSRRKKAQGKVKEEKLPVSASPARSAVLKGEHKVLNLSGRSASVSAVADESPRREPGNKKEARGSEASVKTEQDSKESIVVAKNEEVKQEASPKLKAEKVEAPLPAALPVQCVSRRPPSWKKHEHRIPEDPSQSASPACALALALAFGVLGHVPLTFAVGVVGFFSLSLALSFGISSASAQQPSETPPQPESQPRPQQSTQPPPLRCAQL